MKENSRATGQTFANVCLTSLSICLAIVQSYLVDLSAKNRKYTIPLTLRKKTAMAMIT